MHHDIAFEPHHLAAVENPELVGHQRPVQKLDVDPLLRGHRSLVDIEQGLRKFRFIAGGGLQEDIFSQIEELLLAVVIAGAGVHRYGRAVFHLHFGADDAEFDMVRIGQILGGGLGP